MNIARIVGILAVIFVGSIITFVVVSYAVGVIWLSGGPGCWFAPHPDHFEQQAWIDADPEGSCGTRSGMVDDLMTNRLLPGMTRADVTALLGPPDDQEAGYMLGCSFIDCGWISIDYDARDRVIRAYQRQDD